MAARGRRKKSVSLEEELMALTEEINACEEQIDRLTEKKKELSELKEKKQMEALYKATMESGRTIEEAISLINEKTEEEY